MKSTSITDRDGVLATTARAALDSEEAFSAFKQLEGVRDGVERLSAARGAEYRAIVLEQTPEILAHLDTFKENDRIGKPDLSPYPEGSMSPTTWRYIKVMSDLQVLFGRLDGWHVAEIGVGYGGQCKMVNDLHDVASYTIYDLEPVARLAEKYLTRAQSRVVGKLTLADFNRLGQDAPRDYDLVISNWALSECTREVQDQYIEHVLRRAKHGYITYNQISHLRGIDSYRKGEFIDALGFSTRLREEGLSGIPPELENFILYW